MKEHPGYSVRAQGIPKAVESVDVQCLVATQLDHSMILDELVPGKRLRSLKELWEER
jgi:hypothetical protein